MDNVDRAIIQRLQEGFPVCDRPYLEVSQELGIDESSLLTRLQNMLDDKRLSRFGPMFNVEKWGGAFTLCAMGVAPHEFDAIVAQVNEFPQVAHNYERDHMLNMWFVIATESREEISLVIEDIESLTGYPVYNFPKREEYYVGLRFNV